MPVRTITCPVCRFIQTREIGPAIGPTEIRCGNCGNLIRARESAPGLFDFEVWDGRKDRLGNPIWTYAIQESDRKSRIIA